MNLCVMGVYLGNRSQNSWRDIFQRTVRKGGVKERGGEEGRERQTDRDRRK